MKRITVLYNTIDQQNAVKLSKLSRAQKEDYWDLNERIDRLFTLAFFLTLREKIKIAVHENYSWMSPEKIASSIVKYEENGFAEYEYENKDIYENDLQPLIEKYVQQQFDQIANHTLKIQF